MGRSGPGKDLPDSPLVRAVVSATELACLSEAARTAVAALERVMLARTADGGRWGGARGPHGPVQVHAGRGPGGPVVRPRGHPGQKGPGYGLPDHGHRPGLFRSACLPSAEPVKAARKRTTRRFRS